MHIDMTATDATTLIFGAITMATAPLWAQIPAGAAMAMVCVIIARRTLRARERRSWAA